MEQQKDCEIKESESQCEKALALFSPWAGCPITSDSLSVFLIINIKSNRPRFKKDRYYTKMSHCFYLIYHIFKFKAIYHTLYVVTQ